MTYKSKPQKDLVEAGLESEEFIPEWLFKTNTERNKKVVSMILEGHSVSEVANYMSIRTVAVRDICRAACKYAKSEDALAAIISKKARNVYEDDEENRGLERITYDLIMEHFTKSLIVASKAQSEKIKRKFDAALSDEIKIRAQKIIDEFITSDEANKIVKDAKDSLQKSIDRSASKKISRVEEATLQKLIAAAIVGAGLDGKH